MTLWQQILAKLGKKTKDLIDAKHYFAKDEATLILPDCIIILNRYTNLEVPQEVTMVVPRVEIRRNGRCKDGSSLSTETLLNSITVVSAPRHPLAGEAGEAGEPPTIPPIVEAPAEEAVDSSKTRVKIRYNNKTTK